MDASDDTVRDIVRADPDPFSPGAGALTRFLSALVSEEQTCHTIKPLNRLALQSAILETQYIYIYVSVDRTIDIQQSEA